MERVSAGDAADRVAPLVVTIEATSAAATAGAHDARDAAFPAKPLRDGTQAGALPPLVMTIGLVRLEQPNHARRSRAGVSRKDSVSSMQGCSEAPYSIDLTIVA